MRTPLTAVLLLTSVLLCIAAHPQEGTPAFPAAGEGTAPVAAAPAGGDAGATAEAASDVDILSTIRMLKMTAPQLVSAVPIVSGLQTSLNQYQQVAAALWAQAGPSITAVCQSWAAGKPADAATKAVADKAVSDLGAARGVADKAVDAAVEAFRGILQRDQAALIESARAGQQRRRNGQMGPAGAASLAEYVAHRIVTLRSMMPDEYRAVRVLEAQEIASQIVPSKSRDFVPVTNRVLDGLDAAMNWNDAQFEANRLRLPSMVAQALNLPAVDSSAIKRGEFVKFLSNPRTLALMTELSGGEQAPAASPPAPKQPDIEVANEVAAIVTTLNSLQVSVAQLTLFAPVATTLATGTRTYQASFAARRAQAQQQLIVARKELLAGQPLDEITDATLQLIRAGDIKAKAEQMRAAVDALEAVQRVFTPAQNALIDWRVPPQYQGEANAKVELADARRLAEAMRSTVEFLDNVRYAQVDVYLATRTNKIEDFLRRYVDPRSPDWPRLRQSLFDITDEDKRVSERDWPEAAPGFAARILRGLGVVHSGDGGGAVNADYDWETMYRLFSHPQAGAIIANMQQARATTQ
jgi:hypothetical protein